MFEVNKTANNKNTPTDLDLFKDNNKNIRRKTPDRQH